MSGTPTKPSRSEEQAECRVRKCHQLMRDMHFELSAACGFLLCFNEHAAGSALDKAVTLRDEIEAIKQGAPV